MKKMNTKLLLAALGIGLAVTTTVGSTYAWWTVNTEANISGIEITATDAQTGVFLKTAKDGSYNDNLDLSEMFKNLKFEPVTSANGTSFYALSGDKKYTSKVSVSDGTAPLQGTTYYTKDQSNEYNATEVTADDLTADGKFDKTKKQFYLAKDFFNYAKVGTTGTVNNETVTYYLEIPVYLAMNSSTVSISISSSFDETKATSDNYKSVRYSIEPYRTSYTVASEYVNGVTYYHHIVNDNTYEVASNVTAANVDQFYTKDKLNIYSCEARTEAATDTALKSFNSLYSLDIKDKGAAASKETNINVADYENDDIYNLTKTLENSIDIATSSNTISRTQLTTINDANSPVTTDPMYGVTMVEDTSYKYSMFTLRFWIEGNDAYCYNALSNKVFQGLSFEIVASKAASN